MNAQPIIFTENVRAGVSTITCDECGQRVVNELEHVRQHETQSLSCQDDECADCEGFLHARSEQSCACSCHNEGR